MFRFAFVFTYPTRRLFVLVFCVFVFCVCSPGVPETPSVCAQFHVSIPDAFETHSVSVSHFRQVYFVDYGNTSVVANSDLREFCPQLIESGILEVRNSFFFFWGGGHKHGTRGAEVNCNNRGHKL